MATLPIVPGGWRAVLNFLYDGEPCANVIHYYNDPLVATPTPQDLADAIASKWKFGMQAQVPTTCSLQSVEVIDLGAAAQATYESTAGLPAAGLLAGQQMPNNVTLCVSLLTGKRGAAFRGRIYHVGLREDQVTGNLVGTTTRNELLTVYNSLKAIAAPSNGSQFDMSVLSTVFQGLPRAVPLITKVTAITINATVDSMRRRLPGH